MNWVNVLIHWCERLMPVSGSLNQAVVLILFVFGVVFIGAWIQSRIAQ